MRVGGYIAGWVATPRNFTEFPNRKFRICLTSACQAVNQSGLSRQSIERREELWSISRKQVPRSRLIAHRPPWCQPEMMMKTPWFKGFSISDKFVDELKRIP